MTKIFFATDIHGSDICWNKFLNAGKFYEADVLILGGDITGKAIVPIIELGLGKYRLTLLEQKYEFQGADDLAEMIKRIRSRGYYPYITSLEELEEFKNSPDIVDKLFISEAYKVVQQWMEIATRKMKGSGVRVYVSPGNDDRFEVDDIIRANPCVTLAEGLVIELDSFHEMITSGWSNRTPWNTYREEDEPQLSLRYEAMISCLKNPKNSIFNIHVPPHNSNLDEAPELDDQLRPKYAGNALKPTGSTALRNAIEKFQPILGLHGHIHEGRGSARIGKTLCINPGSMYEQGTLLGAIIDLGKNKIDNYVLTSG